MHNQQQDNVDNIDNVKEQLDYNSLIDLQTSVAHLEVTVDELNQVITKQDKQIQDLQRQLQLMYNYLHTNSSDGIAPFDLVADKPPHY